ncbi:hypothetical protein ACI8AV_13680 [Geodermatophilus sp. SYSU D00804]
MTADEGAARSTGTAPSETHVAAKQVVRLAPEGTARDLPAPALADPTAEVVEIRPYRETRGLRVRCPFGRHQHLHGYGWETDEPVEPRVIHRVAHCGSGGYYVVIPAWAAELVRPGSARRGGVR